MTRRKDYAWNYGSHFEREFWKYHLRWLDNHIARFGNSYWQIKGFNS